MNLFRHELKVFFHSGKSSLLFVLLTVISWGAMMGGHPLDTIESTTLVWVLFFSLVSSAGITTSVFIRERLTGVLEVLLTSGLSRRRIVLEKLLFSYGVVLVMGLLTFVVAIGVSGVLYDKLYSLNVVIQYFVAYSGGALVLVSSSAWFALLLSNPRVAYLFNFLLISVLSGIALYLQGNSSYWLSLVVTFFMPTLFFVYLAIGQLSKESVLQKPLL